MKKREKVKKIHILVIIARGLTNHWKQVAYIFTCNSIDIAKQNTFLIKVIHALFSVDLHVVTISSDMTSSNRVLWSMNDIYLIKTQVNFKSLHPAIY